MREIWYFNKYKILLKEKTGWHVQYMLQHIKRLSAIQAVHEDAFNSQAMTFMAMFKLLMDLIPGQHMWHTDF
jgi:Uri superfamily endonuclease